jgi:fibronectin type 3 domain-containing protein
LRKALTLPLAILAILLSGIVGVVFLRVRANEKPPTVLLKWDPPAPKPGLSIAGYNIYRIEQDGTYKAIASGVKVPKYIDRDVRRGMSYRYYVQAVDAAGHESPLSNQASVEIPGAGHE